MDCTVNFYYCLGDGCCLLSKPKNMLKFGSTAALDCRTSRYCEKELLLLLVLLIQLNLTPQLRAYYHIYYHLTMTINVCMKVSMQKKSCRISVRKRFLHLCTYRVCKVSIFWEGHKILINLGDFFFQVLLPEYLNCAIPVGLP